nr:hypothetical protein CFP56_33808 [Quercus suber]
MTAFSVKFQTVLMWVQVWGLPFDLINKEAGRDIGQGIGKVIEVNCKAIATDQARFLQVRVDIPLDKPIHWGAPVLSLEGDKASDSLAAQSSRDGNPNRYDIDGAKTDPQQTINSGNGHSYHSTSINEEGNPDIMEVVECTKLNGPDTNDEQYPDINAGQNPKINAEMFINVPIMYVDNGVNNVQSLECETLATLVLDGQAHGRTKVTQAKVPKWTKITREFMESKEIENNSGAIGKKRGHVGKNKDGGDSKCLKGATKN